MIERPAVPRVRNEPAYESAFEVASLPLLLRLRAAALRARSKTLAGLLDKSAKRVFEAVHLSTGVPLTGRLSLRRGDETIPLKFDGRNTHFASLYMNAGPLAYEAEVVALISAILPDDGVFYDIGSNFGYFSLNMAARPGFRGRIHAFEPNPRAYADFTSFISQASMAEIVSAHGCALSDHQGNRHLRIDSAHTALAKLAEGGEGMSVDVETLDGLELPAPHVLKVDVEGHELSVLRGGEEMLRRDRPAIVFESLRYGPLGRTFEIFDYLESLNYIFLVPAWYMEDDHAWFFDRVLTAPSANDKSYRLGLLPYEHYNRFLLNDNLNVLAWPRERVGVLAKIFDKVIE